MTLAYINILTTELSRLLVFSVVLYNCPERFSSTFEIVVYAGCTKKPANN